MRRTTGDVGCHLCGSIRRRTLNVEDGGVVRCADCGLVYRHPRPTGAELERHYEQSYYEEQARLADRIVAARVPLYRRFLADWAGHGSGGRLLDVGAGYGHFVKLAIAAGWDAHGLDPSPRACRIARDELGVTVHLGTLVRSELLRDQPFDRVTLWNVLDQMAEPRLELERVRALLRPGGRVCVRVPNVTFHRAVHAMHRAGGALLRRAGIGDPSLFMTFNYGPATLRRLLGAAGFDDVQVRNSPLTSGDPYGTLGPAGAIVRLLKLAATAASGLVAPFHRDALVAPSIYAEGTAPDDDPAGHSDRSSAMRTRS